MKSKPKVILCALLWLNCTYLSAQGPNLNERTVIVGGTLIDGTGSAPRKDAVVVIEGTRIARVGQVGQVSYSPNDKVIRAEGKFILPGLTDAHVHYRDWVGEMFLAHGVTSIVDMGSPTDWILAQRDGIAKGKIVGPRIFASGDQLGINAPAANPEQARTTVRRLIAAGVNKIAVTMLQDPDVLKVVVQEAHQAGIPISAWTMYPREAIALGVDALEHAYTLGIATKYNDPKMLESIREEQRRDFPVYSYKRHPLNTLIEDEADDLIELLVQKGTYVIPDLVLDFKYINDRYKDFERQNIELLTRPEFRYAPVDDFIPILMNNSESGLPRTGAGIYGTLDREGDEGKKWQRGYRNVQQFLRKFVPRGGKVLAGSDGPNMMLPGPGLHHEMQLLVDAGLSPMQAIQAATKWPAMFLRKEKELGTIEPGKIADVVILRADPLQNIANTQTIDLVIKDGRALDTRYHHDFTNPIPRPVSFEVEWNQRPVLTSIAPMAAIEGQTATLTIKGRDFVKNSVAVFGGEKIPTRFVDDDELKATVPDLLLRRAGTFSVTVWTPKPGGGMSNDAKFIVRFK